MNNSMYILWLFAPGSILMTVIEFDLWFKRRHEKHKAFPVRHILEKKPGKHASKHGEQLRFEHRQVTEKLIKHPYDTVKPVYKDHLMGYYSAFRSSSMWPLAT